MTTSLTIVMPVFNEQATIDLAIARVLQVQYPCPMELIVVDDGSSDDTPGLLDALTAAGDGRLVILHHLVNAGKGAAVRTGVDRARGTHVIVLDADLEYDPADIPAMLMPVLRGDADHVFGTRVFGVNARFTSFKFAMGGRLTTLIANVAFDSILLRGGVRPYEVPISYNGRSVEEGKKISWRDGVRCLGIVARVRAERTPQYLPPIPATANPLHQPYWDRVHASSSRVTSINRVTAVPGTGAAVSA